MTRDYKPVPRKQKTAGKGSVFFSGFLFGLLVGVGASVAVAIFVKGGDSPFTPADKPSATETVPAPADSAEPTQPTNTDAQPDANRFDFYKILPGTESQVTEQEIQRNEAAQQPAAPTAANESYYLQVGAFQTEQEADNLKAKLALLGLEAVVQTATVPDKGTWHRVRVGPYSKLEQITKARTELVQNGFNADLVKIHSNSPDQ